MIGQFSPLWTDWLIYLLVASCIGFIFYGRNRDHIVAPWRQVFQKTAAMIALVVLLSFILVGLLDSIHFRGASAGENEPAQNPDAGQIISVLDWLLSDPRHHVEKTYSTPFALHAYQEESIMDLANGQSIRVYPRLKYAGTHLQGDYERIGDISKRLCFAIVGSLLVWVLFLGLFLFILSKKQKQTFSNILQVVMAGRTRLPWRVILLTIWVVFFFIAIVIVLAGKYHILGTDKVGEDIFYQSLKSIRTGLVIGSLTTLIMLPAAIFLGICAGYFKGRVDDLIQYLYTTLSSIPGILLIAAGILTLQVYMDNHPKIFDNITRADTRLLFLCMILGITSWTGLCRLLRGETLKLRELDYVQAAQAFGVGRIRIIIRHILPNVMHIILIAVVLDFSALVLAEAVLSYVGIGVDPTMNSWGNMINQARLELAREPIVWWSVSSAFVFMFTLVLAANIFSDAVRDAFDPRLRK